MKKLIYIQPAALQIPLDVEQMVANTPATSGLVNGDGSDGNINYGGEDNGGDGDDDDFGGLVKGDNGIWDDMW